MQVLGETEISYLESLSPEVREERVTFMLSLGMSLVVVSRGVEVKWAELVGAKRIEDLRSTLELLHRELSLKAGA